MSSLSQLLFAAIPVQYIATQSADYEYMYTFGTDAVLLLVVPSNE